MAGGSYIVGGVNAIGGLGGLVGVVLVTAPLNPSEAQRKAIIGFLSRPYPHYDPYKPDYEGWLDAFLAAANSIPEGPPVGTIARRPDGAFVAVRVLAEDLEQYWTYTCVDHSGPDDDWPDRNDADSWPVIYDPREYEGTEYDPETGLHWFKPGEEPLVPRPDPHGTVNLDGTLPTFTPDPTAQQEPPKGLYGKYRVERVDGKPIRACFVLEYLDDLHANKALLEYAFSVERVNPELAKDLRTEWGKWPGRSQQEPGESLARGLDDLAAGRVSRRDDYLEPENPEYCGNCDGRKCMGCVFREYDHDCADDCPDCCTTARTPRVVDRLGVDERGSRWLDASGLVWSFKNGWWKTMDDGLEYGCVDPSIRGPFKEILEPRVLPSLECEEARDGTVWTEKTGEWVYWFNESGWRTDSGILGGDYPLYQPRLLSIVGPYTEVLPDVG
ncbi:hypothetical protein PROPHIBWHA1_30 [Mycobacterium phage prophiBWHA-1]|nr:hypothetical protein PROPHIBWHA1_30 [Mycobacterium phage prophiBWHA-1]